jgi:hypothetical protein
MTFPEELVALMRAQPQQDQFPLPAGRGSVELDLVRGDTIGCELHSLEVDRAQPAPPINTWAEAVAAKVTGLGEPVKVLEIDPISHFATLRSTTPTTQQSRTTYFEIKLIHPQYAYVCRFQYDQAAGTSRQSVPFTLTHEALAQVIDAVSE